MQGNHVSIDTQLVDVLHSSLALLTITTPSVVTAKLATGTITISVF